MGIFDRLADQRGPQETSEERAYVEAVILMTYADGVIEADEVLELYRKFSAQSELSACSEQDIKNLIDRSITALYEQGIDDRITAIAKILTAKDRRLEAIELALAVCIADRDIAPAELAMLKQMQAHFGLSNAELAPLVYKYRDMFDQLVGPIGMWSLSEERAYVEAVIIMANADGIIDDKEIDELNRKFMTQPKLNKLGESDIRELIDTTVIALEEQGIEKRIEAIAAILTATPQRLEAIDLALAICLSDAEVAPAELVVLKQMQTQFELTDAQIAPLINKYRNIFDQLAGRRGPQETSVERAYVEAAVLMVFADGVVEKGEIAELNHKFATHPRLSQLSGKEINALIDRSIVAMKKEGAHDRVSALARLLETPEQRLEAIKIALEVCLADADAAPNELALLKVMQARFELPDEQIAPLVAKHTQP
ncbi:MAG: TerB family tellurite resistance protein [Anaerolineae bacterium]|nr:TerB family tellurite resistance protein [Anaerolineae bacterium]